MHHPLCTPPLKWRRSRRRGDDGASMLGVLSVVVILGLLVVIPLSLNLGSSTTTTSAPGATTTTAPRTIARGASEAAVAACRADFETIDQAIASYRALNGSYPPSGTSWATSSTAGGPYLQSWPIVATRWSFAWNGATLSVVPTHGVASHGSFVTTVAKDGCFATFTS